MFVIVIDFFYVEVGKCFDIIGFYNDSVSSFYWCGIIVMMFVSGLKVEKIFLVVVSGEVYVGERILDDIMLIVGEFVVIMGFLGFGKIMFLNRLVYWVMLLKVKFVGDVFINDVYVIIFDI